MYLQCNREGATWAELRDKLGLPYTRACPNWTHKLEKEIGLIRREGVGRALVWEIPAISSKSKKPTKP